jgi:hypothetical protein
MEVQCTRKRIICAVGFATFGMVSASSYAHVGEYRQGYDQGYRDGIEVQSSRELQRAPQGRIHIEEARYGIRGASWDAQDSVQQAVG